MKKRVFLILFCCLLSVVAQARIVKNITVSAQEAFTDHLSLKNDTKDMDLMVKFVFDESNESLTVMLISYRNLFVFQDDTRYKQVVSWWSRKLKVDKFPYVVTADEGQQFRLTSEMKRSIPKPRRKHVFNRWVYYDGLIPQPTAFKMVNDVIEQKFDIKNKRDNVTVTLRDVFLMEQDAKKPNRFWLVYGKDLDTKYQITLQRDPCFTKAEEIKGARESLANLQKIYVRFHSLYKDGTVHSQEALDAFNTRKKAIMQQFPPQFLESRCEDLQNVWDKYNACLDSISAMKCKVKPIEIPAPKPQPMPQDASAGNAGNAASQLPPQAAPPRTNTSVSSLLMKARQIDSYVAQWLLSKDKSERSSLEQLCRNLVSEGNKVISNSPASSTDMQRAIRLFRSAERYFKNTCTK